MVDLFRDGGGEADDVVIEDLLMVFLAFDQAGQIGEPFVATSLIFLKSLAGTTPSLTSASLARSSICNQILSLFSSVQMARIAGRE